MKVHINLKLYASLGRYMPETAEKYSIEQGVTVKKLMHDLDVSGEIPLLVFIDGQRGSATSLLEGGETVKVFPPLGGG